MTQQTMTPINPEDLEAVNDLLQFLVEKADPDYRSVMEATLTQRELESNLRKLDDNLAEFGLDQPVGAIPAGTGITKDEAGFEGEAGQTLIRILKASGRLQQCGKGRGKCLLILSGEPFEDATPAAATAPATNGEARDETRVDVEAMADADVRGMLRTIDQQMTSLLRERDDLRRELRRVQAQSAGLEAEKSTLEEQVANLRNELEQRYATTWN